MNITEHLLALLRAGALNVKHEKRKIFIFKCAVVTASLAVTVLASFNCFAAVVGGGSTLPTKLYGTAVGTGILASQVPGFTPYVGVENGEGKKAFFTNDSTRLKLAPGVTVDFAGSDSIVTQAELAAYNSDAVKGRAAYGPLIQIPVAFTSVAVPYRIDGKTALQLTSSQLADIFAGKINNWNQMLFNGTADPNLPIKVVYLQESSGTTEILTNHLRAMNFYSVPFVSSNFAAAFGFNPATSAPVGSSYIAVTSNQGAVDTIANNNGAIGYVSPDYTRFNDASAVASINGYLPSDTSVHATIDTVMPPIPGSDEASNPLNWVTMFANPRVGYPIVGYTNLIFSQCYKDAGDTTRIRVFLNRHNSGGNNAVVSSRSFIPVSAIWQKAIYDTFYAPTSALRVGNPDTCNGIGRPL